MFYDAQPSHGKTYENAQPSSDAPTTTEVYVWNGGFSGDPTIDQVVPPSAGYVSSIEYIWDDPTVQELETEEVTATYWDDIEGEKTIYGIKVIDVPTGAMLVIPNADGYAFSDFCTCYAPEHKTWFPNESLVLQGNSSGIVPVLMPIDGFYVDVTFSVEAL